MTDGVWGSIRPRAGRRPLLVAGAATLALASIAAIWFAVRAPDAPTGHELGAATDSVMPPAASLPVESDAQPGPAPEPRPSFAQTSEPPAEPAPEPAPAAPPIAVPIAPASVLPRHSTQREGSKPPRAEASSKAKAKARSAEEILNQRVFQSKKP